MGQRWLSIVEYARTYAVSDMTVRRRIKNGKLQAQLKDGKYYIPVDYEKVAETSSFSRDPVSPVVNKSLNGGISDSSVVRPVKRVVANNIPTRITENLVSEESVSVDANSLIEFCNAAVSRIGSIETHLNVAFKNKLNSLEATVKLKDNEISQLRQKVEDLEMLVKMLDTKTVSPAIINLSRHMKKIYSRCQWHGCRFFSYCYIQPRQKLALSVWILAGGS